MTARDAREKNFHSTRLYNPQEGISDEKLKFLSRLKSENFISERENQKQTKKIFPFCSSRFPSLKCVPQGCAGSDWTEKWMRMVNRGPIFKEGGGPAC